MTGLVTNFGEAWKDRKYENMENYESIFQKRAAALFCVESAAIGGPPGSGFAVEIVLAHIGPRSAAGDEFHILTDLYVKRASALVPSESISFRKEEDLLAWLNRKQGRTPAVAVLLDPRGRQMTSEALAGWVGERRDQGTRQLVFAIGPADGWSEAARQRAQLLLSLGTLTMAHALARLVMAEQIYRACTILAGHPYHRKAGNRD